MDASPGSPRRPWTSSSLSSGRNGSSTSRALPAEARRPNRKLREQPRTAGTLTRRYKNRLLRPSIPMCQDRTAPSRDRARSGKATTPCWRASARSTLGQQNSTLASRSAKGRISSRAKYWSLKERVRTRKSRQITSELTCRQKTRTNPKQTETNRNKPKRPAIYLVLNQLVSSYSQLVARNINQGVRDGNGSQRAPFR